MIATGFADMGFDVDIGPLFAVDIYEQFHVNILYIYMCIEIWSKYLNENVSFRLPKRQPSKP